MLSNKNMRLGDVDNYYKQFGRKCRLHHPPHLTVRSAVCLNEPWEVMGRTRSPHACVLSVQYFMPRRKLASGLVINRLVCHAFTIIRTSTPRSFFIFFDKRSRFPF